VVMPALCHGPGRMADPRSRALLQTARVAAGKLAWTGPAALARMGGTTIASPSAAGWVTDFLNAAYYARPAGERHVDDLRLAFCILTTRWHRGGRRLKLSDLRAFHRAFGEQRASRAARMRRPTLDRAALMAGAARLFGAGFEAGYADPERRGFGIVFEDAGAKKAYVPERRLEDGCLGELTPPRRQPEEQRWHTYRPVPLPSAAAALETLGQTDRWPHFGSELGRFTATRSSGLLGQTFEIEVVARPAAHTPIFTRGYVTATRLLLRERDGQDLEAYVADVQRGMAAGHSEGDDRPAPPGATPCALLELTTHAGHFMGRAISRLLIFDQGHEAFIRDIGSWDPMPPQLAVPYRLGGHAAQVRFWGEGRPDESMLHQIALAAED
jgi:hypothetical protein